MIPRNRTKKLYFAKWPYKIEFRLQGATMLRRMSIPKIKAWCALSEQERKNDWWFRGVDATELLRFVNALEPCLTSEHQFRAEYHTLNLYTRDKNIISSAEQQCKEWAVSVWEPGSQEELDLMLSNKRKVVCDELPYGEYKYRVSLKERAPAPVKAQFKTWAEGYGDNTVKFSTSTVMWLRNEKTYCQTPFFYLKDDKLLTMCQLFLGHNIKFVEEYIPRYTLISE